MNSKSKKITGKILKSWYDWLKKEDCGCCHQYIGHNDDVEFDICMGWRKFYNDGYSRWNENNHTWKIVWQIACQPIGNTMQSDLDVDFKRIWLDEFDDCTGEIDDDMTMKDWDLLSIEITDKIEKVFLKNKLEIA